MSGDERRNLFTYATKELSQDAFLMWLFNNYDCEEVGPVAYALLQKFCNLAEDEKIRALETKAQWKDIDISVWFETDKNKKCALFIEDKVDSGEHNQLEKYNGHIKEEEKKGKEVYKVYYKPGYLYPDEIDRVEKAGWKWFSFDKICEMLKPFAGSSHLIVKQYIEHVLAITKALFNTEKPKSNGTKDNRREWIGYFVNTIIPAITDLAIEFTVHNAQFSYVYLKGTVPNKKEIPTIEIRSSECCGENFEARILCYEVIDSRKREALIERIKKQGYYKKTGDIKQVGLIKMKEVHTTEEFIAAVRQSVQAYLDLMKDWDGPLSNNSEK